MHRPEYFQESMQPEKLADYKDLQPDLRTSVEVVCSKRQQNSYVQVSHWNCFELKFAYWKVFGFKKKFDFYFYNCSMCAYVLTRISVGGCEICIKQFTHSNGFQSGDR